MTGQITNQKQFLEKVADRKLVQGSSWVIISATGSVNGEGPDEVPISGNWTWNETYYCRDISIDSVPLPHDCQTVTLDGNIVSFIHDKGRGITLSWVLE